MDTSSVDVMLLSKFTHLSAFLIHILSHSSLSQLFATWNAAISMKRFFDALNTLEQFQKERETRKDNLWELKFVSAVFRAEFRLLALTR